MRPIIKNGVGILCPKEYDTLLDTIFCKDLKYGYREIINPLLYTGMRSAKAGRLTWEDIDFDREEISIREDIAKQGIARTVMMPKELKEILQRYKGVYDKYMEYRKVMGENTLNSLFFKRKKNGVIEPLD